MRLSWQRRQGLSFDTVQLAASSVAAVSHETDCWNKLVHQRWLDNTHTKLRNSRIVYVKKVWLSFNRTTLEMGNCKGKGSDSFNKQNSSAFDRVTSRTSTDDDCLLYQLADYQKGMKQRWFNLLLTMIVIMSKGGDLIRYFTKEGPRATEELLKEQIPMLLYRKGEGQMVRRSDYLKWKYRKKRHVS